MKTFHAICPEALRVRANHIATCLGLTIDDILTFDKAPRVYDSQDREYRWCSVQVPDNFDECFDRPLIKPEFDKENNVSLGPAQGILNSAIRFTQAMLEPGHNLPNITNKLVVSSEVEARSMLNAFQLASRDD